MHDAQRDDVTTDADARLIWFAVCDLANDQNNSKTGAVFLWQQLAAILSVLSSFLFIAHCAFLCMQSQN
jgi:hypothetical protein